MLEGPGSAERLQELKSRFRAVSRRYENRANRLRDLYTFALVATGTFAFGWSWSMWSPLSFRELAEGLLTAIN
jgi:hypothetical protein